MERVLIIGIGSGHGGLLARRLKRSHTVIGTDREPWSSKPPQQINHADGCLECRNTGFMGRTGIYEIFKFSPGVRNLLNEQVDIADVRRQAIQEGMRPLRLSGAQKVAAGMTTVDEVLRVTPPPTGS